MDAGTWPGILSIGIGAIITWLVMRSRATDRPAIEDFARQRGLRIVLLRRSYISLPFRHQFLASTLARYYKVAVEDSDAKRSEMKIVFDPMGAKQFDLRDERHAGDHGLFLLSWKD